MLNPPFIRRSASASTIAAMPSSPFPLAPSRPPAPAARRAGMPTRAPTPGSARLPLLPLLALLLGLGLGLACPMAQAGRDGDHDRARAAVQAGEVMPLPAVLERLKRSHPGQVLELELEREDGRWVYEFKLLAPDGGLLKLQLDARTGAVLAERRRDRGERRDRDREAERR